ncbi:major histocompatibility complex class I-related protein 1-like isoform X2 [Carettochelys insculpta]|uniref:major histocompatibility complex class I-related protein 1-like isoform X2 n=1 Tax=Carettochelys insculpta TaxID=44489 RepID=UPI003EBD7F31
MAGALLLALLGGVLAAPAHGGHHRLGILVTAVTDEETHRYFMMAQLDDVKIAHYSSDTREVRPAQAWVAQAVGAEYVKEKTQEFLRHDLGSKVETKWWMQLHNQTGGIHTEQVHVSCALSGQAARDLRYQYAYDGRDFISFDHQTGTWVAAAPLAFIQKQRWETGRTYTQYVQRFLQHECLGTLRSLMQQGKVVLEQQGTSSSAKLETKWWMEQDNQTGGECQSYRTTGQEGTPRGPDGCWHSRAIGQVWLLGHPCSAGISPLASACLSLPLPGWNIPTLHCESVHLGKSEPGKAQPSWP